MPTKQRQNALSFRLHPSNFQGVHKQAERGRLPSPRFSLEKSIIMKYRTRTEIVVEILRSALESSKKTTIMYRSAITLRQLREYLPLLVGEGLLEFISETKLYKTTSKGVHAMKVLEHMKMVFGSSGACSPSPTFQEQGQYCTPLVMHYLVPLFSPANDNKNRME